MDCMGSAKLMLYEYLLEIRVLCEVDAATVVILYQLFSCSDSSFVVKSYR